MKSRFLAIAASGMIWAFGSTAYASEVYTLSDTQLDAVTAGTAPAIAVTVNIGNTCNAIQCNQVTLVALGGDIKNFEIKQENEIEVKVKVKKNRRNGNGRPGPG